MNPLEQARRDFMQENPNLYNYIRAHVSTRVMDEAASLASGAVDGHGAANRCYAASAAYQEKTKQ